MFLKRSRAILDFFWIRIFSRQNPPLEIDEVDALAKLFGPPCITAWLCKNRFRDSNYSYISATDSSARCGDCSQDGDFEMLGHGRSVSHNW
jgi:hypothetical protein